jgi:DNA polymerase-3 subunit gamma/tau
MVLVRMAYAADLPTPDEVIRTLAGNGTSARAERNGGGAALPAATGSQVSRVEMSRAEPPRGTPRGALAQAAQPAGDPTARNAETAPAPAPLAVGRFEDLVALAAEKRDLSVKTALERDVRVVRCEDGRLDIALEPSAAKTLVHDLARKFSQWTGRRWMVVVSAEQGQPTVRSQLEAQKAELKTDARADPLVQAVLARFPGAEIVDVRKGAAAAPLGDAARDDSALEPPPVDDGLAYGADWRADPEDDNL